MSSKDLCPVNFEEDIDLMLLVQIVMLQSS